MVTIEMTISRTFWCPRPLNRGVRLIKVSFKVNKGNKFWDFGYCPLNRYVIEGVRLIRCPLNTGFTVVCNELFAPNTYFSFKMSLTMT